MQCAVIVDHCNFPDEKFSNVKRICCLYDRHAADKMPVISARMKIQCQTVLFWNQINPQTTWLCNPTCLSKIVPYSLCCHILVLSKQLQKSNLFSFISWKNWKNVKYSRF